MIKKIAAFISNSLLKNNLLYCYLWYVKTTASGF